MSVLLAALFVLGCRFTFDRQLSPGELTGRVEAILPVGNTQTFAPVAGASVQLLGNSLSVTTDSQGSFRFQLLEPGTYFIVVTAVATDGTPIGLIELSVNMTPGEGVDLGTLRLGAAGAIYGTVYLDEADGGRVPVGGAEMAVLEADGGILLGLPEIQSDSDGGYSIPFLPAGEERVDAFFALTLGGVTHAFAGVSNPVMVVPRTSSRVDITLTNPERGPVLDAGLNEADAGPSDAGAMPVDGGPADAGMVTADSGLPDSGPVDSGPPDSGIEVTTLAGNGMFGYMDGTGGPNGTAEFEEPEGVAVDSLGNVYVADAFENRILKIDSSGNVTTLAGNGSSGSTDGTGGATGTAEFDQPSGVAVDAAGNVYVADEINDRVRKIDTSGNVTTLAGNGSQGSKDGTGGRNGAAEFAYPAGLAVDAQGNVYVAEQINNDVRKIDPQGNVTTLAGNGTAGFMDGTGGASGTAEFDAPNDVAVDVEGNAYVVDYGTGRVRKIDPSGNVTTLAGNGMSGHVDGTGGPTGTAEFNGPSGVSVDSSGNVYVAEQNDGRVRKIDPAGNVTTLAGNGIGSYADGTGGPNGTAELANPYGAAVDSSGSVYVSDLEELRIRKITQLAAITDAGSP